MDEIGAYLDDFSDKDIDRILSGKVSNKDLNKMFGGYNFVDDDFPGWDFKESKVVKEAWDAKAPGAYGERIFNYLDQMSGDHIQWFLSEYDWREALGTDSIYTRDIYDAIGAYLETNSGYGLYTDLDRYCYHNKLLDESKSIKEEYIEATPNDKDCFAFITTINKRTRETKRQRIEGSYGKIRGIIASKQRNETLYDFEGPFKNESKSIKESNDINPDIWKAIGRHFDYIIAEKAAEILENLADRALMQDNVEDTYEAVISAIDDGLFNSADIWEINALYDECQLSDNAYSCLIEDLVQIVDTVRTGDLNEGLNLTESTEKQYVAIDTQDKDNKDNNRKYTEKQLIDFAKELIKIEEESSEPDQYKKRPELKDDLASAKKVLKYFMYDVKEAE